MVIAWVTSLPAAALASWIVFQIANGVANLTNTVIGATVAFVLLLIGVGLIVMEANKNPVHSGNVNDDWDDNSNSPAATSDNSRGKSGSRETASVGADREVDNAERYGHTDADEPADFVDTRSGIRTRHHVIDRKDK